MTVYLPVAFDQDRFNITTTEAAFYYYDNHARKDNIYKSVCRTISVTVQSCIYATGIATGSFNGTVFKPNGNTAFIAEGKFKAKTR